MNNKVYKIYKEQVLSNKHHWTNLQLEVIEKIYSAINENFHVGNIYLREIGLKVLPNFSWVSCNFFSCSYNQLTSLRGCPRKVDGDFMCSSNKLTTLEGAPRLVGGDFSCSRNEIITLEKGPIKVYGNFFCNYNKLKNLKGQPKFVKGTSYFLYNSFTKAKKN